VIRVEALEKSYAGFRAVKGISFFVERGEIVGFLGPNGAGKTTTLRILCGFLPATTGQVTVNGHDVIRASREVRRSVGYLPEDVPLYRDMKVTAYLRYLAGLKEVPSGKLAAEIDRVVAITGLEPVAARLVGKCSKGFRQRTGLAAALLGDPPVLLLDEPTSGLDPNQVVEVRDLIRHLSGEKTVLLSSHILSEVAQICGRVIIISDGVLAGTGTPADLAAGETTVFVRTRPALGAAAWAAVNGVDVVEAAGADGAFRLRCADPEAAAPQVARAAVEAGADLLELRRESADLERVFRRLTGGDHA
jgi:ABC-2 type transport system ATP-binding protein